ncbi:MAG: lpxK [Bacteroidetes bacterium]|jgi:tetraacyldisaccharide 4'-kinase|nr:lpxK [Bacteroidota bacterium]
MVVAVRNKFYDWNIFKSRSFPEIKTICVGNLCAGGSGKTPHVDYIIQLLKKNYKIATLSRGYKRKTKGYILAGSTATAETIGDEPMIFHTKHEEIMVSVDTSRVHGIDQLLLEKEAPDVVILDDAFQHRAVKAGLNILLTDYSELYIHDSFLPAGRLRESKTNSIRADIIIVTKTPDKASNVDIRSVIKDIKPFPYQSLFFSYLKYGNLYNFSDPKEIIKPALDLFKYNVVLFSGIANPKPLHTFVKEYANDVDIKVYPDHHAYTESDIDTILAAFEKIPGENKLLITTEKDAVKFISSPFSERIKNLPLFVLPIEIDLRNKTQEFNDLILKYVRANKIYHRKYTGSD